MLPHSGADMCKYVCDSLHVCMIRVRKCDSICAYFYIQTEGECVCMCTSVRAHGDNMGMRSGDVLCLCMYSWGRVSSWHGHGCWIIYPCRLPRCAQMSGAQKAVRF